MRFRPQSMRVRKRPTGPYAEFIIRARGTAEHPENSIELDSSFDPMFIKILKLNIPHRTGRNWDPDLGRWFINPEFLEVAKSVAVKFFPSVYLVDGETTENVVDGSRFAQPALF